MLLSYYFKISFTLQVQLHWHTYTEKMDRMVEEAFRLNVKWSLQELSRAINGDGKSGPNPLFKVKVVLEKEKDKDRVSNYSLSLYFLMYLLVHF